MISDDLRRAYEAALRTDIPRPVLVEVAQSFPLAAAQARTAVLNSTDVVEGGVQLSRPRAAKAAGLLRFQVLDEAFEQIVLRNGGEIISRVAIDHGSDGAKDAPVFLTTGKFGGTLLGFASHREITDLPIRNASRVALCSQNRGLIRDMFAPLESFDQRDRFALVLAQRDPSDIGRIASLNISIIDPKFEGFLLQSDLNDFLAGYGERPAVPVRTIELKRDARRFKDKDGPDHASGTK